MEKIAILIKTFERKEFLYNCIESIKEHLKDIPYKIYISDDGTIDNEKNDFYKKLEEEGHFVLRLPYNVGANPGRIALLPYITENYILRMDDDFLITKETRLDKMLILIKNKDNIGAVSDLERQLIENKGVVAGKIRTKDSQGIIKIIGKTLIKKFIDYHKIKYREIEGIKFYAIDFCRNFILLKKKLLEEAVWDYRLKFSGEHLDFMLQIKNSKKYKLVFTPESIHVHAGPPPEELKYNYKKICFDEDMKKIKSNIFRKKWKIYNFASYHQDDSVIKKIKIIFKAIIKGYLFI